MAKRKKKRKKQPSWDQIGETIGKKIDKELKEKKEKDWCTPWAKWHTHAHEGSGFVGRLLFVIGVLLALNTLGYLQGISGGVLFLIGAGFALMKF